MCGITGYIGGKNGLYGKLGNFSTMDEFFKNMLASTGKISPLASVFHATSMLIGDTLTRTLYLSSFAT